MMHINIRSRKRLRKFPISCSLHTPLGNQTLLKISARHLWSTVLGSVCRPTMLLPHWKFIISNFVSSKIELMHLFNKFSRESTRTDTQNRVLNILILSKVGKGSGGFIGAQTERPLGAQNSEGAPNQGGSSSQYFY